MNILVTGSRGQLGTELLLCSNKGKHNLIVTDIIEEINYNGNKGIKILKLDISDLEAVKQMVKNENIDLIINCAAYTNVDKAEDEPELAYLVNAESVKNLATVAKEVGAKMIHISTDYVFDGQHWTPYKEYHIVNPLGVYGKTKYQGEEFAQDILGPDCIIIRTAWLYSNYGKNFVMTMANLGIIKDEIKVIFDQIGTPTYAHDLADAIWTIVNANNWVGGIYHYSNEGVCSWYDFAKEIMDVYGLKCKVLPIHTDEYPTKADRPHYSVLDKTKIKKTYNIDIPHWKDALKKCHDVNLF